MRPRMFLALAGAIASSVVGVVPASPAVTGTSEVSPTPLPPSAPGRLAYSTADYYPDSGLAVNGLGTIGLDGSDQRVLTDPVPPEGTSYAGYDHSPQWSPDGNWLAYHQDRPAPGGSGTVDSVVVIPRDGGNPQVIDPDGWGPAWSPDGRHLAWVSPDGYGTHSLEIADVETTPSTITVTNHRTLEVPEPAQSVGRPTFSPNGQSLAFVNGEDLSHTTVLYTISTSGEQLRQVSHDVAVKRGGGSYAYSPDGTRLMFLATSEDSRDAPQTYLVDVDGTDQQLISEPGTWTQYATWAPRGDAIAMVTSWVGSGVTLVGLDGQKLDSLARSRFSTVDGLTFSPDGSRIYSVAAPYSQSEWKPDLYAIPVNGEEPQRLTFDHSVFPTTLQAIDPGLVLRQFGNSPSDTAEAAVSENVDTADTIVVAPTDDYAASLASAPLAGRLGAPALVSRSESLSPQVLETAESLEASHVVLVGGFSSEVATALRAAGLTVSRVGNTLSPYRVSAAVASRLTSRKAFVVPAGTDHPGGWKLPLATAGYAAFKHRPMLYTTSSFVPKVTRRTIQSLGITSVTVVGGDKDVSPRLLRQLSLLGVAVHRLRSSNRYEISARLAERAVTAGARTSSPVVSSGAGWTSSAAAPALAALLGQATVLVDDRTLADSRPTATWLSHHRRTIDTANLLGGPRTVRPVVEVQLERRVGG